MRFIEFTSILESKTKPLQEGHKINLQFIDDDGTHNTKCQLVEFGWGIDRSRLYHRFKVIESDSKIYIVGAEFNLPMIFDDSIVTFLFYPFFNEKPRLRSMSEFIRKSYIKIV